MRYSEIIEKYSENNNEYKYKFKIQICLKFFGFLTLVE